MRSRLAEMSGTRYAVLQSSKRQKTTERRVFARSGQIRPSIDQSWPEFGQHRPTVLGLDQNWPGIGHTSPEFGQLWPHTSPISTYSRPNSVTVFPGSRPRSAQFDQHRPGIDHNWPSADHFWSGNAQQQFSVSTPVFARHIDQRLPGHGQILPDGGQVWLDFGKRCATGGGGTTIVSERCPSCRPSPRIDPAARRAAQPIVPCHLQRASKDQGLPRKVGRRNTRARRQQMGASAPLASFAQYRRRRKHIGGRRARHIVHSAVTLAHCVSLAFCLPSFRCCISAPTATHALSVVSARQIWEFDIG